MNDRLPIIPQHSPDPRDALNDVERHLASPEDAAALAPPGPSAVEERLAAADRTLGQSLCDLDRTPPVDVRAVIESRRPRIGPALIRGQRWLRRLTGWYLAPLTEQVRVWQERSHATIQALAEAQHAQHAAWEERLDVRIGQLTEAIADRMANTQQRLATLESAVQIAQGVQADLLNEYRLLGRLDRLERLVQVLRLAERDLPVEPALGTRDLLARDAADRPATPLPDRLGAPAGPPDPGLIDLLRTAPGPILDLGCGNGMFLRGCRDAGIDAYGIDESPERVATCRDAGLSAFRDSVLTHLGGLADASLGGIWADHILEHFESGDLWQAIRLAGDKVRAGGVLVVLAPDPRTLIVGASEFWRNPTNRRPLHPDTLVTLLEVARFTEITVHERNADPEGERLPEPGPQADPALAAAVEQLNRLLYGPRTFLITARRAAGEPTP